MCKVASLDVFWANYTNVRKVVVPEGGYSHVHKKTWCGLAEDAVFPKTSGKSAGTGQRRVVRLRGLVQAWEIERILAEARSDTQEYNTNPDSVDGQATYETYLVVGGQYLHSGLREVIKPLATDRIEQFARQLYNSAEVTVCTCLLRRYLPGERRSHPTHHDIDAYCTVVVGLNPQDFEGGLFVQSAPHISSRAFLPLGAGDAVFHRYDLEHGVEVFSGQRYSLIFWLKESRTSCLEDSLPWYEREAAAGDVDAQALLGGLYHLGRPPLSRDEERAAHWYGLAAAQGQAGAMLNLGMLCAERGWLQEAAAWYAEAAEVGAATAQRGLAEVLWQGRGAKRDEEKAVMWMERAAAQGDTEAAWKLSRMLVSCHDIPTDPIRAAEFTEVAAASGHAAAAMECGRCSLQEGLEATAVTHFLVASKGGVVEAILALGKLVLSSAVSPSSASSQADEDRLTGAVAAAMAWMQQAAKSGCAEAQFCLAESHLAGAGGLPVDHGLAKHWCRSAAAQGHPRAQGLLETISLDATSHPGVSAMPVPIVHSFPGLEEDDDLLWPLLVKDLCPNVCGEAFPHLIRGLGELAGTAAAVLEDDGDREAGSDLHLVRRTTLAALMHEVQMKLRDKPFYANCPGALRQPVMTTLCEFPAELADGHVNGLDVAVAGPGAVSPRRQIRTEGSTNSSVATNWWWTCLAMGRVVWVLQRDDHELGNEERWEVRQNPGDLLLVPAGWWHEGRCEELMLALSPACGDVLDVDPL